MVWIYSSDFLLLQMLLFFVREDFRMTHNFNRERAFHFNTSNTHCSVFINLYKLCFVITRSDFIKVLVQQTTFVRCNQISIFMLCFPENGNRKRFDCIKHSSGDNGGTWAPSKRRKRQHTDTFYALIDPTLYWGKALPNLISNGNILDA